MTTLTLWALGGLALAQPRFTEVAAAAGIDHVQHAARESPDCLFGNGTFCEPERMSGAVAVGDFDGDGRDDLFFTVLDGRDRLYRNLGGGRFEEVGQAAGFVDVAATNGATWVDIDRDGDLDLYLTSLATLRFDLWVNDGGRFTEDAQARGAALTSRFPHFGWSIGVGDYDRDGWVDLVVGEWFAAFVIRGLAVANMAVLRNRGADAPGHFEVTQDAVSLGLWALSNDGVWAFSPSFDDLDGDGWPDLLLASDFHTSRLFWNDGEGGFEDGTDAAGLGTDENGMGSTVADFDGDGLLDWFVTSIWDPANTCDEERCGWRHDGNRLYRNLGDRRFEDVTDAVGVREGFWGWGAVFFDADNDGDLDLLMTNGVDFPSAQQDAPFNEDPMRFWRNDDGEFVEQSEAAGLLDTASGKGVATLDYDGDGDLDIVITRNAATPLLYRNDTQNDNAWLRVRLVGRDSNWEGLGARVTVRPAGGGPAQLRVVSAQSYFLGQSERVAHFGLGADVEAVDVSVWWPTGEVDEARCLPVRRAIRWVEGVPPAQGECPVPAPDGGVVDGAVPDAGDRDGPPLDADLDGALPDARVPDAAPTDGPALDFTAADAAPPDRVTPDGPAADLGAADRGFADAAAMDGPLPDGAAADGRADGAPDMQDAAADAQVKSDASTASCDCRSTPGSAFFGLLLGVRRRRRPPRW